MLRSKYVCAKCSYHRDTAEVAELWTSKADCSSNITQWPTNHKSSRNERAQGSSTSIKDLKIESNSDAWWASVQERQETMPPLKNAPMKPTKSNCSSVSSGFRSGRASHVSKNSSEPLANVSLTTDISMRRSCQDGYELCSKFREGSKSEPRNFSSLVKKRALPSSRRTSRRFRKTERKLRRRKSNQDESRSAVLGKSKMRKIR